MDEDRVKGAVKTKVGEVKEAAGKALGDQKLKREGQTDKVATRKTTGADERPPQGATGAQGPGYLALAA
jgi:uncharacterized protein YjbJ (UPF0337 family)